ncbi:hypothetical protein BMS3Abin03_01941 [bacterium BMS3Abin03]|nr:hypothetical protein BMS3Abin03_01941 [bacterium BMS3Abin03]
MDVTLFITENCSSCQRVESQLKKILKNKNKINLLIEDIKIVRSLGIVIAPALFIDDELYSYGDLDEDKFLEQISPG